MVSKDIKSLIYIIIFAIIYILILLFFLLAWRNANRTFYAETNPQFWCWNDWKCFNTCDESNNNVNDCFINPDNPNLAECLYGPNSTLLQEIKTCYQDGSCPCPDALNNTNNCLKGCAGSRNQIRSDTTCDLKRPS